MKRCGNIFAFTYAHPKKLQNRLRNHAVSLSEKRGCETNKDLIEKGLRPTSTSPEMDIRVNEHRPH